MKKQFAATLAILICGSAQASTGSWIEPNLGQTDPAVRAIARDGELTMLLEPQRARVLLPRSETIAAGDDGETVEKKNGLLLELVLYGADAGADVIMGEPRGAVSRYFRGNDPEAWITDVNHYDSLRFVDVYPDIDLVYKLRDGHIEYDFEIEAGADSSQIRLGLLGSGDLSLDAGGDLVARTEAGEFRQRAPEVFRVAAGGLQPVAGAFQLDGNTFGFEVDTGAAGDKLIIDPVIEFSGYVAGSLDDTGSDIALNSRGNLVVNGTTRSVDIPGSQCCIALGEQDLYFAEIDRNTGELLWISFVGGSGSDWADSMALDSNDDIVAVGYTESPDFPTVNAFQSVFVGSEDSGINWDGLVVKLADDGTQVLFATYYGGLDWEFLSNNTLGFEWFRGIAIDDNDHIHVAGQTGAPDFPVTTTFRGRACMQGDETASPGFVSDITLVEFAPDGTRLFATCIGGTARDAGRDVALGADGRTYVGGFSRSNDLPTSADAFQTVPAAPPLYTPFVLKLNPARTDIEWGTYFGGSGVHFMQEIAVGTDGSVVGSGSTNSVDFPVTPNALQPVVNAGQGTADGPMDAFVVKLNATGTALDYASYFGGVEFDEAFATGLDESGRIYFAGSTNSRDLIERTSLQPGFRPLFGSTLSVDSGAVNAIANLQFLVTGFGEVPVAVVARNGVNRYHRQVSENLYWSLDVGVESANSVDAVIGDFGGLEFLKDIFFVNSFAENSVYLFSSGQYFLDRHVGGTGTDSRAAAGIPNAHVAIANFAQPNELYLGASGAPLLLGRPDGNTVDVVTGDFGGTDPGADIVFANQGQEISLLRSQAFPNYDIPVTLSLTSPTVSVLAAGDINGDNEMDLVIGNNPGPIQFITFSAGVPGPVQEIPASAAATNALALIDVDGDDDLDLFAGNDGPDSFYYNDGVAGFSAVGELPSIDATTQSLTFDCEPNDLGIVICEPWVGTDEGLSRYKLTAQDIFVAVIDPATGVLEFSSYLDSGASDTALRGLTVGAGGQILTVGTGRGDAWPSTGGGATASTDSNAVFVEIDIDIDDDTVLDGSDNCLDVANPLQRDTDNDAYGNFCDPDLNNDGMVNFVDLQLFKQRFFGADPDADLDGDGIVNFADLQIAKAFIFGPPGPSGLLLP